MFHIYVAFIVAKQQVQIFESKEEFPTEQACKAKIPDALAEANGVLMQNKLLGEVEVVGALCSDHKPEPQKPKGDSI